MTSKSDKTNRLKKWTPDGMGPLDRTASTARAIVEDEASRRAEKTERLRAARLAKEHPSGDPAGDGGDEAD
ncbi:MAG: hypothetical protein KGN33_14325 [Paracoccaceae bacterium]|nr:hypothetical protein [Paracoccaceae bacterium]